MADVTTGNLNQDHHICCPCARKTKAALEAMQKEVERLKASIISKDEIIRSQRAAFFKESNRVAELEAQVDSMKADAQSVVDHFLALKGEGHKKGCAGRYGATGDINCDCREVETEADKTAIELTYALAKIERLEDALEAMQARVAELEDIAGDYAALESMRENYSPEEIDAACSHIAFGHRWVYEPGYYAEAKAALDKGEVAKCQDCKQALKEKDDE